MRKDTLKVLIVKIAVTIFDLEIIAKQIFNLNQKKELGFTMFIFYRQILVYLKNCFDLFNQNFEKTVGIKVANDFSGKKKKLMKLLKPYSNVRNDIGGHLETKIIENFIENSVPIDFNANYKTIAIISNIKLIETSLNSMSLEKVYDLSDVKDLKEVGKNMADVVTDSKKLMIAILADIQKHGKGRGWGV